VVVGQEDPSGRFLHGRLRLVHLLGYSSSP
jgi:hypothetical protein